MTDTLRCPDCGHGNPAGATSCEACNYPIAGPPGNARSAPAVPPEPGSPQAQPPERAAPPPLLRPIRTRRPRPKADLPLRLWLLFGTLSALVVVYIAIQANVERAREPARNTNEGERRRAEQLRAALARDSTDLEARIGLADALYNVAEWPEAIVHYRSAVRQDSSRTTAIVDLGVCYYNLGQTAEAERHFMLALARDPHQPIALFNLGIVNERREKYEEALKYFHRALQSAPPEPMQQPLQEAMQRVMKQLGRTAPPLGGG